MERNERFHKAEAVAKLGIFGNLYLALFKSIIGVYANSRALIADAVNSASDVAASLIVMLGLKMAKKPPDEEHPYGHGKAESIAAIIVAVLLCIAGFEIGKSSFLAFFKPIDSPKFVAVFAILASILLKEIMFRYTYKMGKKLQSEALIATAYDHRSDVYSSSAAFFGVVLAIAGDYFHFPFLVYADPVAGLFVSLLILKMAFHLGKESVMNTMDLVLPESETDRYCKIVEEVDGVEKVDELLARVHGHYVIIDIKIAVDPSITVEEGHHAAKAVKALLMKEHNVENVFVHVNPYYPEKGK